MRIALLIYGSLETVSGGYLYDRKLVEYLQRAGEEVEILSLPWRDYPHHLADNLSPGLLRRLQRLEVDVLLQDELNHPSLFWINRRLGGQTPIVSIVHHLRSRELRPAWQNLFYGWIERQYLSSVDGFIFNSRTTCRAVEECLWRTPRRRIPPPSIIAYPAGDRLDPQMGELEIARRAREEGPLRLLFVGNLVPRKGLHKLLAALARLPREGWTLTVAGSHQADPAYSRSVLGQTAALGVARRVTFAGPLSDAALAARMRASHALVMPSSYEGFGIVYLEGMGFGLPAIATTAGGAGEIITDGLDGFLVPPENPAALAARLNELAADRSRLAAMGLAALQRYRSHPTWQQCGEQIRGFLSSAF